MATFSSIFMLIAIVDCSLAVTFKIERSDGTGIANDDFTLPVSQCPATPQKCAVYKGEKLTVTCWCYCPRIQDEATAFFESTNECTQVRRIRQQAGESAEDRFTFLPYQKSIFERDVHVPTNQRCSFYYGDQFYVQYLDCTGSWTSITTQSVLDTLELTPGWSATNLKIRIKDGTTLFENVTEGRLVRVAIQCRSEVPHVQYASSCVVFQVPGIIECPHPKPTLSPGTTPATLPIPVTVALNATAILPPVTTPAEPATSPSSEKATTKGETTQSPAEGTTTPPTEGNGNVGAESGKRAQSQKNTFIIAGSVAGGILLIALILLILWRCNSPKKRPNQHRRLEGTISRPVSHMSRGSIPVYTDASYMTPMGNFTERTRSMDNPTYRRSSDGIILTSADIKRGSIYSDRFSPTSAPPDHLPAQSD
ncbi:hypothetical protein OS493_035773 [Desmophyllum pertusum]|uniref:Uncharacterized protein n=1 Tax=Desmophyllum pertusum TaxID=174260 RepID=A0A9X0CNS8_9CNID|nr:hypothetical protein OS493_035773 [Desmophyllum pertusum]